MNQPFQTYDLPVKGIVLATSAFFFFAVMNAFARYMGESFNAVELAFWRNLLCVFPMGAYILLSGQKSAFTPNNIPAVAFRAVIGTVSLCLTLGTFIVLPMADATAFVFSSALLVPIASFFILKEKVGPYRWGAVVVGFLGVLILVNPGGQVHTLGVSLALATAVSHTILQIHLRYLGKTENPLTTVFYFFAGGTFLAGLAMPFLGHMPAAADIPLLLGIGLSGFLGQICITHAFKYAEASVITVFNYSGIVWATLIGWAVWNEWPAVHIWIGSAIVISCNLFIFFRERKRSKEAA